MKRSLALLGDLRFVAPLLGFLIFRRLIDVARTQISDPDVWWVAAAGRELLESGRFPRTNLFSIPDFASQAWVMHEWLFAAPYAWGLERMGPPFLTLVSLICGAVVFTLLLATTVGRARRVAAGALLAAVAIASFSEYVGSTRPTWIALAFPLAMIALLFGRRVTWASVVAATLLELAWANAHGSFPLGIALVVVAWFDRPPDRRRLLVCGMTVALVTLVNPYGVELHRLVIEYSLGSAGSLHAMGSVREFSPIWNPSYRRLVSNASLAGLALVLALAAAGWLLHRHRARCAFVLLLLAHAGLHARQAPWAMFLGAALLVPVLDALLERVAPAPVSASPRAPALALAVGVPLALSLGLFGHLVRTRAPDDWYFWSLGGSHVSRLIDAIAREPARAPERNTFGPFNLGGRLIWEGYPRGVRVLYDSRNDCYPEAVRSRFLNLVDASPAALLETLDEFHAEFAIVPSAAAAPRRLAGSHLAKRLGSFEPILARSPAWRALARDGGWVLFGRAPAPRPGIDEAPGAAAGGALSAPDGSRNPRS